MILVISLIINFFSNSFAQEYSPAVDPNKFTVCAITINSDEEKKVFESQIKKFPSKFNPIVELTNFGESDWFEKACSSKIRCDQLVISGHFGGVFFGSSGKTLELTKLENMGCSKSCEGILSHPYESFLFGCNTLSTKEKDHRTPAQYLQVLLNDGIPRAQAELVVESRYGIVGDDHKSKMIRAFGGEVKHLYGFDSVGPSGKNVEGFLKDYFSKVHPVSHLQKLQAKRLLGKVDQANVVLATSLKNTAFAQCSAGDLADKNSEIICKLRNNQLGVDKRLEVVFDALSSENYLMFIPSINEFFKSHPVSTMNKDQQKRVLELSSNKKIKEQVEGLLDKTKSLTLMVEWSNFAFNLGLITEEERVRNLNRVLNNVFTAPLTISDKDLICSLSDDVKFKISPEPSSLNGRKLNAYDIESLSCLRVQNKELHRKLIADMSVLDKYGRKKLAADFGHIKPQDKEIQLLLLATSKNDLLDGREAIVSAFGLIVPKDKEVQLKLAQFLKDNDLSIRQRTASLFEDLKPQEREVQLKILEGLQDKDSVVRRYVVYAIQSTDTKDKEVLLGLSNALSDKDLEVRRKTVKAFAKMNVQDKDAQLKLLESLSFESSQENRNEIAATFKKLKPQNKEVQFKLATALSEDSSFKDSDIRAQLVDAFIGMKPQDKDVQLKIIEAFQYDNSSLISLFGSIPVQNGTVKDRLKKISNKMNEQDRKKFKEALGGSM